MKTYMNEGSRFQPQKAENLFSFEQVVLDLESRIHERGYEIPFTVI